MKRILAVFMALTLVIFPFPGVHADDGALSEPADTDAYPALEANQAEARLLSSGSPAELISATEIGEAYFNQTIEKFADDEAGFSDPQISGYTDAEFFGEYDGTSWTTPSLLNYEDFPGLQTVCEAAKAGQYEAAKEALLAYYQNRFADTELTNGSSKTETSMNGAVLNLESVVSALDVLDIIKVTKDIQEFNINVTGAVAEAITGSTGRAAFTLAAIRKDGNTGVFYSKESDYKPSLVVTIDGRNYSFEPIADTYIQAGEGIDQNFGDAPVLLAEESYSTIGAPQFSRADSYTYRSYLLFDLSEIDPDAKVSNARLYVSGNILKSSNPVGPDALPSYKDIAVLSSEDTQWTDDSYTWSACTNVMDYISYNGEYWYEPYTISLLNRAAKNSIEVYNATGEEAYAYAAVRMVITGIVHMLTSEDGVWNQTSLQLNSFLCDFPYVMGSLLRMPQMTPEKFTLLLKFMHAATEESVNVWTTSEEQANWGAASACAIMISAIIFPEFTAADDPLIETSVDVGGGKKGGWRAVGEFRVSYVAGNCLFEDGSCVEVSYAYTRYILNLFNRIFTLFDVLHMNARDILSDELLSVFEQYAVYMMNQSTPLGTSFQQGDDSGDGNALRGYSLMLDAFDNPYLDWLESDKTKGRGPEEYLSSAYDIGRKAVLRSGWEKTALAAQINADGGYLSHGHSDDLGLNVFAYGKMLLADPRQPNYKVEEPVTAWLYSTRGHNTVEINNTTQRGDGSAQTMTLVNPDGEEETFYSGVQSGRPGSLHPETREFNPQYNYIQAETLNYQEHKGLDENFTDIRDVLMVSPRFIIVTDYLKPDNSDNDEDNNIYSQYWHSVPNANMSMDSESGIAKTNFAAGANLTIVPVQNAVTAESSLHTGWYNTENQFADYVRYQKQAPGAVTFNTVLYPTTATEDVKLTAKSLATELPEHEASALRFTAANQKIGSVTEVQYYNLHDKTKQAQRSFGDYSTDGTLALAQKNGELYERAILRNGTHLTEAGGADIIRSKSGVTDLGVLWNGTEISLSSSKSFVKESFTDQPEDGENLALGKRGISSEHFSSDVPLNAFDGNLSTAWTSSWEFTGSDDSYPWLAVELGEEKTVSKLVITGNDASADYNISYMDQTGSWKEVVVTNSYSDPLGDESSLAKTYCFEPVHARSVKIQANRGFNMSIYEMEVYSGLANGISLYDLSIYAPDSVSRVYVNGESMPVFKNGQYLVFDESLASGDVSEKPDNGSQGSGGGSAGGGNHGGGGVNVGGGMGGSTGGGSTPTVIPDKPGSPFDSELDGHWGESEIRAMIEKGIVQGSGSSLELKKSVTRAEFAALLVRGLQLEEKAYDGEFLDVSGEEWYAGTLATAVSAGIMEGSDGKAMPNDPLTREQMAKMLAQAYILLHPDAELEMQALTFADTDRISDWAVDYVAAAVNFGIMNGMDNNCFQPSGTALREQAFAATYRLISK